MNRDQPTVALPVELVDELVRLASRSAVQVLRDTLADRVADRNPAVVRAVLETERVRVGKAGAYRAAVRRLRPDVY